MATLSSDKTYVTVQKGDTLSQIAVTYKSYTGGASYQKLAEINGISNPNRIYVGQKIYFKKSSSGGSSSSSTTAKKNSNQVYDIKFGLQSNTDNTFFATWKWDKDHTKGYKVQWSYTTGDGIEFKGEESEETWRQSTYTPPSQAIGVVFRVKPIATTHTVNKKEVDWWTAEWSPKQKTYLNDIVPPETPTAPTVELKNGKLTASLNNIADGSKQIEFQVVQNDAKVYKSGTANVVTYAASYSCDVASGADYKVRCRAIRGQLKSEWSQFSSNYDSGPGAVSEITSVKSLTSDSIRIEWSEVSNSDKSDIKYKVEYTTNKSYFDASEGNVRSTTVDAKLVHHAIITGVESGKEYFFRVRAEKGDVYSKWTAIKSLVFGKDPAAPTTWSSSTTVMYGEPLNLYWVHNSKDGSSQTKARIEVVINDVKQPYIEWINTTDEEEKDKTSVYAFPTTGTSLVNGAVILWRVQTMGITGEYGEWSVQRKIDIYDKIEVATTLTDGSSNIINNSRLRSFPLIVRASVDNSLTQKPIGYNVSILANESYETVDNIGNRKLVSEGEAVYAKQFDTESLIIRLSAGFIDLENDISYTVFVTTALSSGVIVDADPVTFTVAWTEHQYQPNAEITIDEANYSAAIRPYCESNEYEYHKVATSANVITRSSEIFSNTAVDGMDSVYTETEEKVLLYKKADGSIGYYCIEYVNAAGVPIDPVYYQVVKSDNYVKDTVINPTILTTVYTKTGEEVFLGIFNSVESLYCMVNKSTLIDGISLSVYRREYDGNFVEIATDLNNTRKTFVTDPHPSLDYARYRIVAIEESTGAVSYYDVPGYPVGGSAIILQWDDVWSNFDTNENDIPEEPSWAGSLLKLPYNVDISPNTNPDVEFVEYIGRDNPVAYYGTQVGETDTWNTDIPATDDETLYALRRLQKWMGDVYVREPSGSGYWANVKVSFGKKHCETTIPVTINVTRVEGGI